MAETIIKHHRHYWEDADHLIKMAREYQSRAESQDDIAQKEYFLYWKYRLARMSFIARMMAVEALLNNALEQYSLQDKFKKLELLAKQFPHRERFPRNRRKRARRPYQVPLKWKLYLAPYLCESASRMERDEYFQYDAGSYRKFRQLIMVRNEFVHTRVVEHEIGIFMRTKSPLPVADSDGLLIADQDYADCCEELGIDKDPLCFRIDNAIVCTQAMKRIVVELNDFMAGRILSKDFWDSDQTDFFV